MMIYIFHTFLQPHDDKYMLSIFVLALGSSILDLVVKERKEYLILSLPSAAMPSIHIRIVTT